MPTELDVGLPLIDHHCHGVSPAELDFAAFQALFSESYKPAPAGTTEFQKPLGLAIRRFCAPVLDLEPSCGALRLAPPRSTADSCKGANCNPC